MPVPTAPPTTTALAAANTAVPRARRPNAAASSRAHTRISDVAPPGVPAGERQGVVVADGPVDDGLPERGDQPGQPGTADREHGRPPAPARGRPRRADRSGGDDRRRAEHGHGPGIRCRGQRVDRAVEVAVDPAGRVVARVAHGEDRDDRRPRAPRPPPRRAGPVGEQRAVGEGHQPTVPKSATGPAALRCTAARSQAAGPTIARTRSPNALRTVVGVARCSRVR